jgi:hypothetical protein
VSRKQGFDFDQLPRKKKRTRLRKLAKTALPDFGIGQAHLRLISDTTNFLFCDTGGLTPYCRLRKSSY